MRNRNVTRIIGILKLITQKINFRNMKKNDILKEKGGGGKSFLKRLVIRSKFDRYKQRIWIQRKTTDEESNTSRNKEHCHHLETS